jgi:RNA polymerase sigma factor (sigma-70 family)
MVEAMEDSELLRAYVESRSEPAFAELTRRHVDLVYSAALRIAGEPQLARDVAQEVFLKLACQAASVRRGNALAAWLYRTAHSQAVNAVRTEARRRRREQEALRMSELEAGSESAWLALRPWLDQAMATLGREEQAALVLRFFTGRSLAEVGRALDISEEAARKRVNRAVEKLRVFFARRGLTVSAPAIGLALAANAVEAAPAAWAASVTTTALAGAAFGGPGAGASGTLICLLKGLTMTKLQTTAVGLLFVAGVLTPFLVNSGPSLKNQATSRGDQTAAAGLFRARANTSLVANATGALPSAGSSAFARLEAWLLQKDQARHPKLARDELRALVWSLAAADYPLAWRLRERLQSADLRGQFQEALLYYWSQLDPRAALTAADGILEERARREAVDRALPTWAEKEPHAALAWVSQSQPEHRRAFRLAAVIQAMAKTDPPGAVAALEMLPLGLNRERALLGVVEQWVEQEPGATAGFVGELPFSSQKARLLFSVAASWARLDPKAELAWLENLSDARERASVLVPSIRGLVDKRNILEAAELIRRFEGDFKDNPGEVDNRCLTPILSTWVESDVPAAKAWALHLPEGPFRETALRSLMTYWSDHEPAGAAAFAATLPEGPTQREGMKNAVAEWCGHDAPSALPWVGELPQGSTRDAALAGVCEGLAWAQPVEAAQVVAHLPPGEVQTQSAVTVVEKWARTDPPAAAAWVAEFPDGPARNLAAKALVNAWAWKDAPAASSWLGSLPADAAREQAAQAYVSLVADKQPALAAAWVNAFTDPARRNEQIETIARQWLARDPAAGRQWLAQTSLPEERKRLLMGQAP